MVLAQDRVQWQVVVLNTRFLVPEYKLRHYLISVTFTIGGRQY